MIKTTVLIALFLLIVLIGCQPKIETVKSQKVLENNAVLSLNVTSSHAQEEIKRAKGMDWIVPQYVRENVVSATVNETRNDVYISLLSNTSIGMLSYQPPVLLKCNYYSGVGWAKRIGCQRNWTQEGLFFQEILDAERTYSGSAQTIYRFLIIKGDFPLKQLTNVTSNIIYEFENCTLINLHYYTINGDALDEASKMRIATRYKEQYC